MEVLRTLKLTVLCVFLIAAFVDKSETLCPSSHRFATNGRVELITDNDGVTLRGVRVSWTYDQAYYTCHGEEFNYLRASIHNGPLPGNRGNQYTEFVKLNFNTYQVEFYNLDCNTQYQLRLQYSYYLSSWSTIYGSSMKSPPAQIPSVIVEQDALDPKSRLSIYWDPIPCHLQYGDDITDYIIKYGLVGTDEVRSITTSDERLSCVQEPVGPFRCYLTSTLLLEDQLYTFQVAGVNGYGVGPFSHPANATLPFSEDNTDDIHDFGSETVMSSVSSVSTGAAEAVQHDNAGGSSQVNSSVWILAGVQIALVVVFIGVITLVLVIVSLLWKRMNVHIKTDQTLSQANKRSDKVLTSKCQAYGVASNEDSAIYEFTA